MKNFNLQRIFILLTLISPGFVGAAEDAPAPASEKDMSDSQVDPARSSALTRHSDRGAALEAFEEVLWFEVDGERRWLAKRPATGIAQGAVLLIAAQGDSANGVGHLAKLRMYLPDYGWDTFYTNMQAGESGVALVDQALGTIANAKKLLLICEASSCDPLAALRTNQFTGVVFLNVPLTEEIRVAKETKQVWLEQQAPGLILQEYPTGWPRDVSVGVGLELHLLPMGTSATENSRVMRKLRGWLKRQLNIG